MRPVRYGKGLRAERKVKPCPIYDCGSNSIDELEDSHSPGDWFYFCIDCRCSGPTSRSKAGALKGWNGMTRIDGQAINITPDGTPELVRCPNNQCRSDDVHYGRSLHRDVVYCSKCGMSGPLSAQSGSPSKTGRKDAAIRWNQLPRSGGGSS